MRGYSALSCCVERWKAPHFSPRPSVRNLLQNIRFHRTREEAVRCCANGFPGCRKHDFHVVRESSLIGINFICHEQSRIFLRTVISVSNISVSYTHLRAHETVLDLVCRLLLEK